MDQCYYVVTDDHGNFSHCKALSVPCCPPKCKFRKTEKEYRTAINNAEQRLRDKKLTPTIDKLENGRYIMTVKKMG